MHRYMRLLSYLTIVLFGFVLYGRFLFDDNVFVGSGTDLIEAMVPFYTAVREALLRGDIPLWTSRIFTGQPLLASGQWGVFYPPTAMLLILDASRFVAFSLWLHTTLAGVAAFKLGWEWSKRAGADDRESDLAGVVACLTVPLCGFFVAHAWAGHVPMIASASWAVATCAASMVVSRTKAFTPVLVMALCFCMSVLAGSPQVAAIGLFGTVIMTIFCQTGLSAWGRILLSLALGLALSAVQWLPSLELSLFSARHRTTMDAWSEPLDPAWIRSLVLPPSFENPPHSPWNFWEHNLFVGLPVITLALLAIADRNMRRIALMLFATASLFLLFALGLPDLSPVPGFGLFRVPARFGLITILALIIVAGLGAVTLSRLIARRLWPFIVIAVLAHPLANAIPSSRGADPKVHSLPGPLLKVFTAASPDRRVLTGSLAAWDKGLSLGFHNFGGYDPAITEPMTALIRTSDTGSIGGAFRSMYLRWPFAERLRYTRILDIFAVEWLLHSALQNTERLTVVAQIGPDVLWHNARAFTRAFLSRCVESADQTTALRAMLDDSYDPTARIFVPDFQECLTDTPVSGTAKVIEDTGNTITVTVKSSSNAWLFVSDLLLPGWKASVDGIETELRSANVAGRVLKIPEGQHIVKMEYTPLSFLAGAAISLTTILCLLLVTVMKRCSSTNDRLKP